MSTFVVSATTPRFAHKALLMRKGSTVPMLVISLGAIGGFVFSGLIRLFTWAIVLSVGYNLIAHWIGEGQN